MNEPIREAVDRIRGWGEARDWHGYDPYDALNSPIAPLLTLGTSLGRRLLTQAVKLSPLNLRGALGIQPGWNAKAIGLIASGYARLAAADHDDQVRDEMRRWLNWLVDGHVGDGNGPAWGYHFPVQTRICFYERYTPNTIATSFVAHALLDAHELLGEDDWAETAYAAATRLSGRMMTHGRHGPYFRYVELDPELIHNANLLACSVLLRVARLFGDKALLEAAAPAVRTTLAAQREDGSWPYGSAPYLSWVDNFHTAYVLECLAECVRQLPEARSSLFRGVEFWQQELFLSDGTPKFYAHRLRPFDAHNVASAIDAWLSLRGLHPKSLENAERLGLLLVERVLDPAGFVVFQPRRVWANRVPFVRWTTAPSLRALAGILLERSRSGKETSSHDEQKNAYLD